MDNLLQNLISDPDNNIQSTKAMKMSQGISSYRLEKLDEGTSHQHRYKKKV